MTFHKTGAAASLADQEQDCEHLEVEVLNGRTLIIAANRGPVTATREEDGTYSFQRGGGGLVTALTGLAKQVDAVWIGSAMTEGDRLWGSGTVDLEDGDGQIQVEFLPVDSRAYHLYYNVIANPLLWFWQHSMWDFVRAPTFTKETWEAWEDGYVAVNRQFAVAIARHIRRSSKPALVMLQDYHLYLAPAMIRELAGRNHEYTLTHFIHIPWPGAEGWGMMPAGMRLPILEGLTALDLIGFQTREDGLNFIRTCESHLQECEVSFKEGWVRIGDHFTYVRDFPISIDVGALRMLSESADVTEHRRVFENRYGDYKIILRVDRTEPSKNIVRGFQAMEELLEMHPEYMGKVVFLALLVPSRMEVEEYQSYLDELMAAAGRVNVAYGDSDWEPVRVLAAENYPRAIAGMQLYDALLVNSIADGMNLVAKEGPIVNRKNGVVILSERTGAREQLESGALVISPCDVHATAKALHQALTLPGDQRQEMASFLQETIEREDISDWLCKQVRSIVILNL